MQTKWRRPRQRLRVEYLWMQTGLVVDLRTRINTENIVGIRREEVAVALEVFPVAVSERHCADRRGSVQVLMFG